ncbi:MAG TPA: ABC transporter permease [Streptosporangiaceae bacterium]|nr:ABC transporter permease [Streptosporangiaceae bacterium]
MSHPERLSPAGGGPASTASKPPRINGNGDAQSGPPGPSLAEFAIQRGLSQSAARPPLRQYIRQLWQRRHFVWTFASSKSISLYTTARLGQLWQVLTPLLNAAVYYLIFGVLLKTSRGIPDFIPFLVTGVFVFTFTQRSVNTGAKSVGDNLSLIRALHFPRASLPFAYVILELQQLMMSLVVLFVIVLVMGEPLTAHWLLLIPVILMQLAFNIGISLVVARLGAFARDITQLLPFVLRTWFYFSGVIFSVAHLQSTFKDHPWVVKLLEINPGYVYVELSRHALLAKYRGFVEDLHHPTGHLWWYAIIWAVVIFVGGFLFFYRAEERYGRG